MCFINVEFPKQVQDDQSAQKCTGDTCPVLLSDDQRCRHVRVSEIQTQITTHVLILPYQIVYYFCYILLFSKN